jgi:predicted transcriptional regulator of viral defense system
MTFNVIMATQTASTAIGSQEVRLLERIRRSGRAVIRVRRDPALFAGFDADTLRHVLKRLADAGWLARIERGVYAVADAPELQRHTQLAIVADWLDGEQYVVSGFFALAHWNLTNFPPSTVDILIDRRRPDVRYGPTLFRFIYVPAERLPEYKEIRVGGARALARVAKPERALADALAGRHATPIETALEAFRRGLRLGILQRRRLADAAREAPSASARRLGWIAEHEHDQLATVLLRLVGNKGYVPLEPKRDATAAKRNTTWRVLENVDLT